MSMIKTHLPINVDNSKSGVVTELVFDINKPSGTETLIKKT